MNALKVSSDPRLRRSPIRESEIAGFKSLQWPYTRRSSICINLYHPVNMQYVYEYVYVCGGWESENESFKNGDWKRESECFKSLEWP